MKKKKSLIVYVFMSYLLLAFGLLFFFFGGFLVTDISGELERNNYKYYHGKVDQKRAELENFMLDQWANEDTWSALKTKLQNSVFTREDLKVNVGLARELIKIIDVHTASGGFIFLDSANEKFDSLFIKRNSSKKTLAARTSYSLLVGNITLAQQLDISLSERWTPSFAHENRENEQLLSYAFNRFRERGEDYFWCRYNVGQQSSMLLMVAVELEGEVRAVVGLEIDENLLNDYLTYVELSAAKKSAYAIVKYNSIYDSYSNEFIYGPTVAAKLGDKVLKFKAINNVNFVTYSGMNYSAFDVDDYVALVFPLRISNKLQAQEFEWFFVAYIDKNEFYIHSASVSELLIQSVFITLLFSAGLAFYISKVMTGPIESISKYAAGSNEQKEIGIREYDHLFDIVGKMSENIRDGSSRLDFVLQLLETKMLILEYKTDNHMVYKYGKGGERLSRLFEVGMEWPTSDIKFSEFLNKVFENVVDIEYCDGGAYKIVTISDEDGEFYMKELSRVEGGVVYRYLIDYTEDIRRERLAAYEDEYDRDTSLLNKDAFKRRLGELLSKNTDSKGAVVMWVLNDLEYINDIYGYDSGDEYLKIVGRTLAKLQQEGILVSRYANNKFVTYIPYEQMRDKVIAVINEYSLILSGQSVHMNDNKAMPIKLTKGIAWYPIDARDVSLLCTYAEYAISSAGKNSQSTSYQFSKAAYDKHVETLSAKEYFDEFLFKKAFDFAFQPIVDIESRRIWGYEALMRPKSRHFIHAEEVLNMAAAHGKSNELEILLFKEIVNKVDKNSELIGEKVLFINSIGNVLVSRRVVGNIFGDKLDCPLVIDMANIEKFDDSALAAKIEWVRQSDFALCFDNFGAWHASGKLLDSKKPEYIKISREIVHNIHIDEEQQKIAVDIVSMCEQRGICVIAVGVETIEEFRYLKSIGVGYAQGFLLAEPKVEIVDFIEDDVLEILNFA